MAKKKSKPKPKIFKDVICPFCQKSAVWVNNSTIYGVSYGKSYMAWYCEPCDAYVGCHNNTREPLGTMANAETRQARRQAHKVIDKLWQGGVYDRHDVYKRLASYFGRDIHIGSCDAAQCAEVIAAVPEIFTRNIG